MRLIDAEALKRVIETYRPNPINPSKMNDYAQGKNNMVDYCIAEIDNAPTVELTEEQAIDKLHETGWLIKHDKEMTERPHGKWIGVVYSKTKMGVGMCNQCGVNRIVDNFCPNCGADMRSENEV